jgi:hypothetical protein
MTGPLQKSTDIPSSSDGGGVKQRSLKEPDGRASDQAETDSAHPCHCIPAWMLQGDSVVITIWFYNINQSANAAFRKEVQSASSRIGEFIGEAASTLTTVAFTVTRVNDIAQLETDREIP